MYFGHVGVGVPPHVLGLWLNSPEPHVLQTLTAVVTVKQSWLRMIFSPLSSLLHVYCAAEANTKMPGSASPFKPFEWLIFNLEAHMILNTIWKHTFIDNRNKLFQETKTSAHSFPWHIWKHILLTNSFVFSLIKNMQVEIRHHIPGEMKHHFGEQ